MRFRWGTKRRVAQRGGSFFMATMDGRGGATRREIMMNMCSHRGGPLCSELGDGALGAPPGPSDFDVTTQQMFLFGVGGFVNDPALGPVGVRLVGIFRCCEQSDSTPLGGRLQRRRAASNARPNHQQINCLFASFHEKKVEPKRAQSKSELGEWQNI